MNSTEVVRAAFATFVKFDCTTGLNSGVGSELREHMCGLLMCSPEELDRALTPAVVDEINGVVRCSNM